MRAACWRPPLVLYKARSAASWCATPQTRNAAGCDGQPNLKGSSAQQLTTRRQACVVAASRSAAMPCRTKAFGADSHGTSKRHRTRRCGARAEHEFKGRTLNHAAESGPSTAVRWAEVRYRPRPASRAGRGDFQSTDKMRSVHPWAESRVRYRRGYVLAVALGAMRAWEPGGAPGRHIRRSAG